MGKAQDRELRLSEWLKEKLKELDWTQRRLAEEAHTTQTTISEIINEKLTLDFVLMLQQRTRKSIRRNN